MEPTTPEKIDPDLQRINELWPLLTEWQKTKLYYRFRFELFKQQAGKAIRAFMALVKPSA